MIVYISIGNSDDRLTQAEWSAFTVRMAAEVTGLGTVHGAWFSPSNARWQNACWCVEFDTPQVALDAREMASELGRTYRQESVAWAVAQTEFV